MTTYNFETITSGEAASLGAIDKINVTSVGALNATVIYAGPNEIVVSLGARAVTFTSQISTISQAGGFIFSDGSRLYIGDGADNTFIAPVDAGSDAIFGGGGNDLLNGQSGGGLLQGNAGADTLSGGVGSDTIYGGQDDDSISTGAGSNFAQGNRGADTVDGGAGVDTILGGQGDDVIRGDGAMDFLNGNLGNDRITGSGQLFGEDGNDTLTAAGAGTSAGAGTVLDGGLGADSLVSLSGNGIIIRGGDGNDVFDLRGSNISDGGNGNDIFFAFSGNRETIDGGNGDDTIYATFEGNKLLYGGEGNDYIGLGSGSSTAFGGGGDDLINSEGGTHFMDGGDGADVLTGFGSDTMTGGAGNDTLRGGDGVDVMRGGGGADLFDLQSSGETVSTVSRVLDWTSEDRIHHSRLSETGFPLDYHERSAADFTTAYNLADGISGGKVVVAVQVGGDVFVFSDLGLSGPLETLMLVGRTLADIDASNIVG